PVGSAALGSGAQRRSDERGTGRNRALRLLARDAVTTAAGTRRESISAYIYAFNEERNIADCIRSVEWCDEIIVVDSHSKDRTVEIARSLGARIIEHPFEGFREQS